MSSRNVMEEFHAFLERIKGRSELAQREGLSQGACGRDTQPPKDRGALATLSTRTKADDDILNFCLGQKEADRSIVCLLSPRYSWKEDTRGSPLPLSQKKKGEKVERGRSLFRCHFCDGAADAPE